MKRVTEKVKDIVEVCPFTHLYDFAADPGLTLAGYHFTDITADLMAKWIDRVANVRSGQGAAFALAGFRGVGKSHFLAVLAAIIAQPELRARILDQHAASSAERLSRRHGSVARVRRGSGTSLLDELKRAIAELLEVNAGTLSDSLYDILLKASEKAGELPLVLLIDTALGRDAAVARDDGVLLSEIAEAAKTLGVFVGVALDDDISGADGANSSISANFTIDYLDQEHLYKIVDTHIFSKHSQMLPLLHEIYAHYREVLPGFRWSEQRFSSLYPLHPAILEIAPLIRLYIHDFALLGFASEAGVKILGRPANSLIGLDEVFDSVETKLRNVSDLKAAFEAFDQLETDVIAKMPVQSRLPGKLILKGLLMLSLNGQGSTAAEIAASMMIFTEPDAGSSAIDVDGLLRSFNEALPNEIACTESGADAKYYFKLNTGNDLNSVLSEATKTVSDDTVWNLLLRQVADKFSDANLDDLGLHSSHCTVEWSGAIRRGRINWGDRGNQTVEKINGHVDWVVQVDQCISQEQSTTEAEDSIIWRLGSATAEEMDTLRRFYLLQNDADIRGIYADGIATAAHVHSIAVEKIWQRLFLQDSFLVDDGVEYRFAEDAGAAHSLSQLFSDVLAPAFASRFPSHPSFPRLLGVKQASSVITDFFIGNNSGSSEVQSLAETFAVPLGLGVKQSDTFIPTATEALMELDIVKLAFDGVDADVVVALDEIAGRMMARPYGLSREAQQLVLSALVAKRQFEFVTSSGNRINHRSLDLQIIWDDIVGVAKPAGNVYSPERLLLWAILITGNSGIGSVERSEDRLLIIDSLSGWLAGWRENQILEKFEKLPDENLNASIWKTAASLQRSFGAMVSAIDALVNNELSLDQCLHTIAEVFSDSEADFENKKSDLRVLRDFTAGASQRDEIVNYLSVCPLTGNAELEDTRQTLLDLLRADGSISAVTQLKTAWDGFRSIYADHYAEKHDAVMNTAGTSHKIKEILTSDDWSLFESLSSIPQFEGRYLSKARELIREGRQLTCEINLTEILAARPYCICSFDLTDFDRLMGIPEQLQNLIRSGLRSFQKFVLKNSDQLVFAISEIPNGNNVVAKEIMDKFDGTKNVSVLTSAEIRLIKMAAIQIYKMGSSRFEEDGQGDDLSSFLTGDVIDWEHEVEQLETFANIDR